MRQAINDLAAGLQQFPLTHEAAEDIDILQTRIVRIAEQVHRTIGRPSEHPPIAFNDDDFGKRDPATEEALADELQKHNRRQQERMQRALEERLKQGESIETPYDNALRDIGLDVPGDEPFAGDESDDLETARDWLRDSDADFDWESEASAEHEAWKDGAADEHENWEGEAAEEHATREGEAPAEPNASDSERNSDFDPFAEADSEVDDEIEEWNRQQHPLMQRVSEFQHRLHLLFHESDQRREPQLHALFGGSGDLFGGCAQALPRDGNDAFFMYGLRVTQFKRALRGAAFAQGALFPLRDLIATDTFNELYQELRQIQAALFQELADLRARYQAEER